jgi:hypothetical protein
MDCFRHFASACAAVLIAISCAPAEAVVQKTVIFKVNAVDEPWPTLDEACEDYYRRIRDGLLAGNAANNAYYEATGSSHREPVPNPIILYIDRYDGSGLCWVGTDVNRHAWAASSAIRYVSCPANSTAINATQCQCNPGYAEQGNACVINLTIALTGPSATKALPAGPALQQLATVTRNGSPAAGESVNISIASGGAISGTTDGNGEFRFTYVPPRKSIIDQLRATCLGCDNTAQKNISVEACDVCDDRKGNPISTVTGEKYQTEPDWQDEGPHGLSLTRYYRSFGGMYSGLGSRNWPTTRMASPSPRPTR